jgi:hypothetical protein
MTRHPRPWMQAHPKKRDDLRLVIQGVLGFIVLLAACAAPGLAR